jgi:glycosyltransferase involved in cell wall biosynthesis
VTSVNLSAYVPCFNNAGLIRRTVESLLAQTVPPREILVIDDGSKDRPERSLAGCNVRIIRHERNLGRGAARARAMAEACCGLVLCCDAGNVLEPAFVERALPWFERDDVAAVVGRISQPPARTVAERWRGRHLFKIQLGQDVRHRARLATWGTMTRAAAVASVGGYSPRLRHSEDGDLGARLLAAGFDVVNDPALEVISIAPNTLGEVLERYWRWYAGEDEQVSWRSYWKTIGYSVKVMAPVDLRDDDVLSVPISLFCPHYQFWRSWLRGLGAGLRR